jgi:23S rRNA (guanosine2251-2'-O)-methyltransferase
MIIYGINPVLESLAASPAKIRRIIIAKDKGGAKIRDIIGRAKRNKIPVQFEPSRALDRQADTRKHQNVLAEVSDVSYEEFSTVMDRDPRLLLACDRVEDPMNLGAVLRTAEAAGIDAVLLPPRHTCGLTSTVVKASAGAAFHLPVCRVGNLAQAVDRLMKLGFWVVGLDAEGSEGIGPIDVSLPLLLVVGGENKGLRRLIKEKCDYLVRLPMQGKVNSLNLSVAAGALIYLIRMRQIDENSQE